MRNPECTECKLGTGAKNRCLWGRGTKAPLMIITESPSDSDDRSGQLMSGDRDALLFKILVDAIGVNLTDVYYTSLIKCCPDKSVKPTAEEAEKCYPYLINEIMDVQPKCIIVMGELGLNFIGNMKGITHNRGQVYDIQYLPDESIPAIKTIFTFLPSYISYNESQLKNYATDINRAWEIATDYVKPLVKQTKIIRVNSVEQVDDLIKYIYQTGVLAFDFETTGLDIFTEDVATCLSISYMPTVAYAIPLTHPENTMDQFMVDEILEKLAVVFADPTIRKVGQNVKFDMHLLRMNGIEVIRGRVDDTMLMHALYDELGKHSLEALTDEYFKEYAGYKEESTHYNWKNMPLDVLVRRNGADADMTLRLGILFEDWLMDDERVYRVYRNMTAPAIKVLEKVEYEGVKIDRALLVKSLERVDVILQEKLRVLRSFPEVQTFEDWKRKQLVNKRVETLREKLITAKSHIAKKYTEQISALQAGTVSIYDGVNFDSPKQLSELLTEDIGIGFGYITVLDSGTGKDPLNDLEDETGFVDALLAYRSIQKIKGTYLEGILKRLDRNNRIHSTYIISGTVTGRLSSKDPNLQNIPSLAKISDPDVIEVVAMVKKIFIPDNEGEELMQADYSQAELRIIADFAEEDTMLEVFNTDGDIHTKTAIKILGITPEKWEKLLDKDKKAKRFHAKAGNFGLIYGMSEEGYVMYAKSNYKLKLTLPQAKRDRKAFFELYPKLLQYHRLYRAKAATYGYVRTLFGRKRQTPNIASYNNTLRSNDERIAINSPIQGTAGEMTIFMLILLSFRLPKQVKLRNTVHDSAVYSLLKRLAEETARMIKLTGEDLPTEKFFGKALQHVKMKVDIEVSEQSWKDMKSFEL